MTQRARNMKNLKIINVIKKLCPSFKFMIMANTLTVTIALKERRKNKNLFDSWIFIFTFFFVVVVVVFESTEDCRVIDSLNYYYLSIQDALQLYKQTLFKQVEHQKYNQLPKNIRWEIRKLTNKKEKKVFLKVFILSTKLHTFPIKYKSTFIYLENI